MPLLRAGAPLADDFLRLDDAAPLPESGAVLVSASRWREEGEALRGSALTLGLALGSADPVESIADSLPRLALVRLDFPKFGDGRAFSQARLLRDRFGFKGEIRAGGQVLRDQYLFMIRCGIDSVETPADKPIAGYRAALAEFSVWYQKAGDPRPSIRELRRARAAREPAPPSIAAAAE